MTRDPFIHHARRCWALPAALAAALLAGCASTPPTPDWKLGALDAAERATQAQLRGNTRVAALQWRRARAEVARTAAPALLARVELLRCAVQAASLDFAPCTAFDALRQDAAPAERAYADYLAGWPLTGAQRALLPAAQQQALRDAAGMADIEDALARLVAAGVAVRSGRAHDGTWALALETASGQGWEGALRGWLQADVLRARQQGDSARAARLERRLQVLGGQGRPAAAPGVSQRAD